MDLAHRRLDDAGAVDAEVLERTLEVRA